MEGEPSPNGYNVKRIGAGIMAVAAVVLLNFVFGRHWYPWFKALWVVAAVGVYFAIALRKPDEKG